APPAWERQAPAWPEPEPREVPPAAARPREAPGPEGFLADPGVRPISVQAPPVEVQAPAPKAGGADVSAVLRALADGAGLRPDAFAGSDPEQLAQEIGTVLRVVVEQTALLLKARAAAKAIAKSSSRTMIGAADNNPLKFVPGATEVLETMFVRRRAGYLDARRSFEEAFADLRMHEIATFAAMQKALGRLLDDLSPDAVMAKVSGSAFSSRKGRAWDLFAERWSAKTDPYENGMLDVFLAYFAEAYDEASKKG
ncbi:type VI secretion system-associated FHA domain protein TagH, partial [Propylenella binzhouense]